jgi:2-amino-4-hydroxy-6-hydroxymethyldihydropteridine diphosphokinase
MANIHINIGSNQNRQYNIATAIEALKMNFSKVVCSEVFESPAYGFKGDDFYNVGVNAMTDLDPETVIQILHHIEQKQGRDRQCAKFSSRTIDLDLVLYDDIINKTHNLPRDDILKYAFVLLPLAQLQPQSIHPIEQKTYTQLSATTPALKSYNIDTLNGEYL